MFMKTITIIITALILIHGLIHLIGFRVYGQGVSMEEMQFKTAFLNGSLDLGESGTRVYGLLWLLPTLGFILAGVGFVLHTAWWQPILIAAALVSIPLTGMDWANAFRGTLIDLALLAAALVSPLAARLGITF